MANLSTLALGVLATLSVASAKPVLYGYDVVEYFSLDSDDDGSFTSAIAEYLRYSLI